MAKQITIQVVGSDKPKVVDEVNTVQEAREEMGLDIGYTATVNGEPADDNDKLRNYETVSFAKATKGGSL